MIARMIPNMAPNMEVIITQLISLELHLLIVDENDNI